MVRLAEFIEKEGALTPGEEALPAGLGSGKPVLIGGMSLPPEGTGEDRVLRAAFLREIILGTFEDLADFGARLHEKGVRLAGAHITGVLDLEGARIPRDIALIYCRFDEAPVLRSAVIDSLFLNGSALPGLRADRLDARGDVVLRDVTAQGEVRLPGAKLGGDLECDGARFTAGAGGVALAADGLESRGGVFLGDVTAAGEVRLLGAKLGGNLDCTGARFTAGAGGVALFADALEARGGVFLRDVTTEGEVRLLGAKLGGDLSCTGARFTAGPEGRALALDGARIGGAFFLRGGAQVKGVLDLTDAEIGSFCDEAANWPGQGDLVLDRCRYGAFTGNDIDAASRIRWLGLQNESLWGDDFWPQPWEQCAKVLREMGHRWDARAVLVEKEKRQRAVARARPFAGDPTSLFYRGLFVGAFAGISAGAAFSLVWAMPAFVLVALITMLKGWGEIADWLLGLSVDYGHRPLKAFAWLALIWLIGLFVFAEAEARGAIKPNQPIVLRGDEWVGCAAPDPADRLDCFLRTPAAASYPAFSPAIYAIDTLLPIVDLEMQGYWIPDDRASTYGWLARGYLWLHIGLGWALSLLAVAGFSGLIRTDSKT